MSFQGRWTLPQILLLHVLSLNLPAQSEVTHNLSEVQEQIYGVIFTSVTKICSASQITLLVPLTLHLGHCVIDEIYTVLPTLSHRSGTHTRYENEMTVSPTTDPEPKELVTFLFAPLFTGLFSTLWFKLLCPSSLPSRS